MSGTWSRAEARERAAFVLGVSVDASDDEARLAYREQLANHSGPGERERTARRTLIRAWATWAEVARDGRLTFGARPSEGDVAAADDVMDMRDDVVELPDDLVELPDDVVIDLRDTGVGVLRGHVEVVEIVRDRGTRLHVRAPDDHGPLLVVDRPAAHAAYEVDADDVPGAGRVWDVSV